MDTDNAINGFIFLTTVMAAGIGTDGRRLLRLYLGRHWRVHDRLASVFRHVCDDVP